MLIAKRPDSPWRQISDALVLTAPLLCNAACGEDLTGLLATDGTATGAMTTTDSSTMTVTSGVSATDSTTPTGTESASESSASTEDAPCGNGQIDPGEACDDGNANPGDGCEPDCTTTPVLPSCGDGKLDPGEQCDDGNEENTDACVACKQAVCDDGFVQEGVEACDDGANNGMYDFCDSACDGPGPRCGDQVENGPEECDDGNQVDDDGCSNDCIAPRLVFVTSGASNGSIGGLTGADTRCSGAAGGLGGPEWQAWLSDDTGSPSTRMNTAYKGWYQLVDGTPIAHGWEDLTDGTLEAAINLTESGTVPPNNLSAWTNTNPDGTVADVANDCMNWTSGSDALSAIRGSATSAMATWTSSGTALCVSGYRLYCFQHTL